MVSQKKIDYVKRLHSLVESHDQVLIVEADRVGSRQMAEIRFKLRDKAVILMGKNTLIRNGLRQKMEDIPKVKSLLGLIKLNVGMIFCKHNLPEIKKIIQESRVPAAAKIGVIAPLDVTVKAGPTGMDPGQTAFFQTLGIATKIVKGQIEIQTDVLVIHEGDIVSATQSTLLQKLKITPFTYGLVATMVYDNGDTYPASVLDVTPESILAKFRSGVANVAAVSLAIHHPTKASAPHLIVDAFKQCTALALAADHTFPQMEVIKKFIEDPTAFAVAAPAASAAAAPVAEKKKEEAKEESEPEEEGDMGFSLFD